MSISAPAPPRAAAAAPPAARVVGLVKRFGTSTALGGITAELPARRILGLVGPDGAGGFTQTTLAARPLPGAGG